MVKREVSDIYTGTIWKNLSKKNSSTKIALRKGNYPFRGKNDGAGNRGEIELRKGETCRNVNVRMEQGDGGDMGRETLGLFSWKKTYDAIKRSQEGGGNQESPCFGALANETLMIWRRGKHLARSPRRPDPQERKKKKKNGRKTKGSSWGAELTLVPPNDRGGEKLGGRSQDQQEKGYAAWGLDQKMDKDNCSKRPARSRAQPKSLQPDMGNDSAEGGGEKMRLVHQNEEKLINQRNDGQLGGETRLRPKGKGAKKWRPQGGPVLGFVQRQLRNTQ